MVKDVQKAGVLEFLELCGEYREGGWFKSKFEEGMVLKEGIVLWVIEDCDAWGMLD